MLNDEQDGGDGALNNMMVVSLGWDCIRKEHHHKYAKLIK